MTPHPKVAMAAVLATTDRSPVAPSPSEAAREAGRPSPERAEALALPRPANDRPGHPALGLRAPVLAAIALEARKGNIKVILWLAARLNCVTTDRTPANDDLTTLLRGLSADELQEFARLGEAERRR